MKTTFYSIVLFVIFAAFRVTAAEPSNALPATIISVVLAEDRRALNIHYEVAGKTYQRALRFTNTIDDFRYCRWLGQRGVAVVAAGQLGDGTEFYYRAFYLDQQSTNDATFKIPAPPGKSQLLGIANTGGDSVVVSAVRHERTGNQDRVKGWVFVDNCPHAAAMGAGLIIPFDAVGEPK